MSQNLNEEQATKHVVLVGLTFLTAGLSALIVFSEPTPLLILGVVFILSPFIASNSQGATNAP